MPTLSLALYRGLVSQLHPRMLALMLVPILTALLLWLLAAIFFWSSAVSWMQSHIQEWSALQWMLAWWPLSLFAAHAATVLLALIAVPVVLVAATLVTGIFAMPMMVAHVARSDYPQLDLRRGGSFIGSAWNGIAALFIFLLLLVVTLPLWLVPLLWPILSLGLLGYLNQRVFRYDALAEHGDAAEIAQIVAEDRGKLFWLGVAVALAAHVPILGFFTPVYGGLVFIHYALARLVALRSAPIEGVVISEDERRLLS
jgi:FtsH-binding integral membrane protein